MNMWDNKVIPFWQKILIFQNRFPILISEGKDYRFGWPESFKPSMSELINELATSKTSYIRLDLKGDRLFINILSGKIIVNCTFSLEKKKIFLNGTNGLIYATNIKKNDFIKYGNRVEHGGIFILTGRSYNQKFTEHDDFALSNHLMGLFHTITKANANLTKTNEIQIKDEDEFNESESSKIEEILETLEAYINKEYEIEDSKARAEKPFVYTNFKAEDIVSTYKYYYRITLIQEDVKRLREMNPSMLQIKKTDETFMDLEIFNIRPENSPNDIIVTTSFQTDQSMIDSSNELYLVAIPTLQKVRQRVIDDLRGKVSPNKWLIPLAAGVYKFKETIKENVPEYNNERPLLPAQKDGVDKGAGSKDITLVLGPPGTGKTTVILSWVKYFVAQGKKVLVTSQSNMAVDNVLIRLDEEKEFECLRVGNESKVMKDAHGLLLENYALNAQSKLVENLSEITKSIHQSKTYLSTLNYALKGLSQYDENDTKFNKEINKYKQYIIEQNDKLSTNTFSINNLTNENEFLGELIKCLMYHQSISDIQIKLYQTEEEFKENEKKGSSLNKQLENSNLKLNNMKDQLIKVQQKVNNYPNMTSVLKFFMYLPNKFNLYKINKLNINIGTLEDKIIKVKQGIEEIISLSINIKKSIEIITTELNLALSNLPVFKYSLTIDNSEEKYVEFFKKQAMYKKISFHVEEKLQQKIEHTKDAFIENTTKLKELKQLMLEGEEHLKLLHSQLENIEKEYLNFTSSKPQIPEFVSCQYIDDSIYARFNNSKEVYDRLITQSTVDLEYYNSLIDVISEWEKSIHSERQSSLYETILEYVDVVGATCIGINSNKLFANIPFDVVIVDESGQIQLHNLMVPLSRASKAILVGDHKQLPPVVDDELAAELEEQGFDPIFLQKSWFEILWDPMPEDHKTMLDTQFRCPAIISDFVSKAFYEDKYFAGSGMEKKQPILPSFNATMAFIDTSNILNSFEQSRVTDGRTEVLGNEVETTIIIKTLMNFIRELPYLAEKNEIGIIVPYKNHVLEVKRTIKKLKLDIGNLNVEDLVASVDSYQGQERDVIIFAFSRSNKGGNIGFLADWRRLNVAMTRTKKQLIMVGSLKTLTMDNNKKHESEFKQAMRILESELSNKNSIIDGRKFFEEDTK